MTDNLQRCPWCGTDPLYVAYHDEEWGVPEHDSRALWEKLILDAKKYKHDKACNNCRKH